MATEGSGGQGSSSIIADAVTPVAAPAKKPKRLTKFNDDWCITHDWLTPGRNDFSAHCMVCRRSFSVGHGGEYDVQKHAKTATHQNSVGGVRRDSDSNNASKSSGHKTSSSTKKLYVVVSKVAPVKKRSTAVIAAEGTFVYHSVRHTHSFMSADCGASLFDSLFTDSKIAERYRCGRTKATKIVSEVLGPESRAAILDDLRQGRSFGVTTDTANRGPVNTFPLLVQYFKPREGVQKRLLCFYTDAECTPTSVATTVLGQLTRWELAIDRLTAFAGNCALDDGSFGGSTSGEPSVVSELRRSNPAVISVGCSAHLIHQAARTSLAVLMFDMEAVVIKIYNELSHTVRRVPGLQELFEWMDGDWSEVLHQLPTRWLSVVPAVERLSRHYEPLKYHFLSERQLHHQTATPPIIKQFFEHRLAEAYLGFVAFVGQILCRTIARLESRDASVLELHTTMTELRSSLQTKKDEKFYGGAARQVLARCWDDQAAYCFALEADAYLAQLLGWLECHDDGKLQVLAALNLDVAAKLTGDELGMTGGGAATALNLDTVLAVVAAFKIGEVDVDALFEELVGLRSFVANEQDDVFQNLGVANKWVHYFSTKSAPNLERIVGHVLSIPLSNAKAERIFGLMKASWRTTRNRIALHTLEAELMVKQNYDFTCKEFRKHLESKAGAHLLAKLKSNKKYN